MNKLLANPFRTYFKIASLGFGLTFGTNVVCHNMYSEATPFTNAPEMATVMLLSKSMYYGLIWPAIPVVLYNQPEKFYVLGHSLTGENFKFVTEEITKMEEQHKKNKK